MGWVGHERVGEQGIVSTGRKQAKDQINRVRTGRESSWWNGQSPGEYNVISREATGSRGETRP